MKEKFDITKAVEALAQAAFDKKGSDIAILDLEGVSMVADYFLIVSAGNAKHAQSIIDEVEDKGAEIGMSVIHQEGYRTGEWVLIDFGDVLVHVFSGEARTFYGLEELWQDAKRLPFEGV